jgi:hypothetical protein
VTTKGPSRPKRPIPANSPFKAPYPETPKTSFGEVPCVSSTSKTAYKATVWTTTQGIDLDGRIFDPKDARTYAKMIERAADECDRMRAAAELASKK